MIQVELLSQNGSVLAKSSRPVIYFTTTTTTTAIANIL